MNKEKCSKIMGLCSMKKNKAEEGVEVGRGALSRAPEEAEGELHVHLAEDRKQWGWGKSRR